MVRGARAIESKYRLMPDTNGVKYRLLQGNYEKAALIRIDETYSYYPYELILPCMSDDIVVYQEPTDVPAPVGRLVAGHDCCH
jgi:hypothetical protein